MASKVEFTIYREAKKLNKTQRYYSNEARQHLLADIITLERQEEAVLVCCDHEFSQGNQT